MTAEATIGDTSYGGVFQIMDTNWNGDGVLRVTVRDNRGTGNSATPHRDLPNMRRLARRALPEYFPGQTRSARVARRFVAEGCPYITFHVSRIEEN